MKEPEPEPLLVVRLQSVFLKLLFKIRETPAFIENVLPKVGDID